MTTILKHLRDKFSRWPLLLSLLLVVGLWFLDASLIETHIVGMIPDDGVYMVLAKALATGQGFHLIHLVSAPAQLKYPILYPAALSLGWLLNPQFPQNLVFLTQLNVFFCIGALLLLFWYLHQLKKMPLLLAWIITLLVGCNYFILYYGTSVMSESLYLLLSIAAMAYAEGYFLKHPQKPKSLLLAVLLSTLLFHTRIIGLSFILALSLMLALQKQWKAFWLYFSSCCGLTLLPWSLWILWHQPSSSHSLNPTVANLYSNYSLEWVNGLAVGHRFQDFCNTLGAYTSSLMENMFPLFNHFTAFHPLPLLENTPAFAYGYLLTLLLFNYGLLGQYLLQGISCLRQNFSHRTTQHFSLPGIYLLLYSLAVIGWNYEDQTSRFLCMLMPWFWYYLLKPLQPFTHWRQYLLTVLLCLAAFDPLPKEVAFLQKIRTHHWMDMGQYPLLWDEYQATFHYIRESLPSQLPLGVGRDVMFYLYTGHPTFHVSAGSVRMKGNIPEEASYQELMDSIDHYHVSYLVIEPQLQGRALRGKENLVARALVEHYPNRFQPLYISPFGMLKIFKILPPSFH